MTGWVTAVVRSVEPFGGRLTHYLAEVLMLATVAAIAISTLVGTGDAQGTGPITKAIERDAARLAAAAPAPEKTARRERGKADWSRLKRLRPGKEIRVKTVTSDRRAIFLKADDQQLWIGTVGIPGSEEVLDAADVLKVSRRERRGSTWGAVGGALAGAAVGFYGALALALSQCGSSCDDEEFFIGLTLVGAPVAGGTLGYFSRRHDVEIVEFERLRR